VNDDGSTRSPFVCVRHRHDGGEVPRSVLRGCWWSVWRWSATTIAFRVLPPSLRTTAEKPRKAPKGVWPRSGQSFGDLGGDSWRVAWPTRPFAISASRRQRSERLSPVNPASHLVRRLFKNHRQDRREPAGPGPTPGERWRAAVRRTAKVERDRDHQDREARRGEARPLGAPGLGVGGQAKRRPMFSGAKNSAGDVTPEFRRMKASIFSGLPAIAVTSWTICSSGGWSDAMPRVIW
jgi:hypothetical protein